MMAAMMLPSIAPPRAALGEISARLLGAGLLAAAVVVAI